MKRTRIQIAKGEFVEAVEDPRVVDLDEEVMLTPSGSRYTAADAEADVEHVLAKLGRGKPSLSGQGTSPQIGVRLPVDLRARLAERAKREGRKESEIVREALAAYLSA